MEKVFFDLECIVPGASKLVDDYIEKYEYRASNKYLKEIVADYNDGRKDQDEYRKLLDEHYDYKDRVLEEVDEKYRNLIDYASIYSAENVDENVYARIKYQATNREIYGIFYYNTDREYQAKERLCRQAFPNCQVVGIRFYNEEYVPRLIRNRVNKAKEILKRFKLDSLEECCLYDKSFISCREWQEQRGTAVYMAPLINAYSKNNSESATKVIK